VFPFLWKLNEISQTVEGSGADVEGSGADVQETGCLLLNR
jgi:hypothetical protein